MPQTQFRPVLVCEVQVRVSHPIRLDRFGAGRGGPLDGLICEIVAFSLQVSLTSWQAAGRIRNWIGQGQVSDFPLRENSDVYL